MSQSQVISSIETQQFPLYHNYIQENKDPTKRRERGFEREQKREGPSRYGNIKIEEANIFNSQALRISSFESELSSFSKYSVLQLAQDGFFNTQRGKEIKCFSCGLLFHLDFDPGDPLKIHQQNNSCHHIRGVDRSNVVFGIFVPSNGFSGEFSNSTTRTERSDAVDVDDISHSSQRTVHLQQVNNQSEVLGQGQNRSTRQDVTAVTPARTTRNIHRQVVVMDFKLELCRLQSFKNWPSNAAVKPDDLANAGFVYMGTDDRVQCTFCRGILRSWEPEDRALAEHLRHFPQCPFLIDPQSVGNVPLGEEDESVFSSIQLREGSGAERDYLANPIPGVHLERPAYPNYAQVPERFKSFKDFPSNAFQKAEELVRAGFYYTGRVDSVKCFFCGISLADWKPADDPWVEHVKASRTCGYVRMTKGEKFIEDILKNNKNPEKSRRDEKRKLRQKAIQSKRHKVKPQDVQRVMASSIVRSVLDMGMASEETVRKVVQQRLQQLGNEFPNAESLIETLSEFAEEEGYSSLSSDDSSGEDVIPHLGAAGSQRDLPPDSPQSPDLPDDEESLLSMNQQLQEERQCKVCLDEMATIVFLRCGHLVCCSNCAPAMSKCPVCRQPIVGTIRAAIQ